MDNEEMFDDDLEGLEDELLLVESSEEDHRGGVLPSRGQPFRCDGISPIVALAFDNKVPIFHGNILGTNSGSNIRIGNGAFSIASISRFLFDTGPDETWSRELQPRFHTRRAGERAVVKQFATGNIGQTPQAMHQLGQELRILAHPYLREHQNIVDIIGLEWEGLPSDPWSREYRWPLLLLEFADCGTLEAFFALDGIEYTWTVKMDLLYDIASGLEGLDRAGVCHSDLKPANVLIFRTGADSFRAKLCDFGSAIVAIDFGFEVQSVPLNAFTPPWDAPESHDKILIEDLEKVDMYSFGLLAFYVVMDGQELFTSKIIDDKLPPDQSARQSLIREWKVQDKVCSLCQAVFHDSIPSRYTNFSDIFALTLRAVPQDRAGEWSDIKMIIKPDIIDEASKELELAHAEQLVADLGDELIKPYFDNNITRSIPDIGRCWQRLPPKGIVARQIYVHLEELCTGLSQPRSNVDRYLRAAEAAYALSLCLVQGFGCETNFPRARHVLVQSAMAGSRTAARHAYRLLGGLGYSLPDQLCDIVSEIAKMAMTRFRDLNQAQDLSEIDNIKYQNAMELMNTNQVQCIEYFGAEIWKSYDSDMTAHFLEMIGRSNSEISSPELEGNGLTWLHYAACRGSAEAVMSLLRISESDINRATDDGGWTPLFMACQAGNYDVAALLLRYGADPTIRTHMGNTCLHQLHAFEPGVMGKIAANLVAGGLAIDAEDFAGETPFAALCHAVCGCEDSDTIIGDLLELGANPLDESSDGHSCVELAAMHLDDKALDLLLQSPHFTTESGNLARAKALRVMMSIPTFERLRRAGRDYSKRLNATLALLMSPESLQAYALLEPGHSPLFDACSWMSADIISALVEADFGTNCSERKHPILMCIRNNQLDMVKILLSSESDLSIVRDSSGWGILHHISFFYPTIMGFMIDELRRLRYDIKAMVNDAEYNSRGLTALDIAIRAENFACADILIQCGAQYAQYTRRAYAEAWFDEYHLFSSLAQAATSTRRLTYLLNLDKYPQLVVSDHGLTLLHLAAADMEIEWSETDPSPAKIVNFLFDHYQAESIAAQPDSNGSTPLHFAALVLNVAVAEVLIQRANVDISPLNKRGHTPLDNLDFYMPGVLEEGRKHPKIGPEIARFIPEDDISRQSQNRRLVAMRTLLERHGAVRGSNLK